MRFITNLELKTVQKGCRRVARIGCYDDELHPVRDGCKRLGLYYYEPGLKVKADTGSYSERGIADKEGNMTFIYAAKDMDTARLAALYELRHDHLKLGELLGYPECCTRFFEEHWEERKNLDSNLEKPILDNSKGDAFSYLNNVFLRAEDMTLLSHFPCSLHCEESRKIAEQRLSLLTREARDFVMKNLKTKIRVQDRVLKFR